MYLQVKKEYIVIDYFEYQRSNYNIAFIICENKVSQRLTGLLEQTKWQKKTNWKTEIGSSLNYASAHYI